MRELPFDINDKIKQDLQTIGNNADPKMQVVVARAKSSIQDSSYFTVENIRTKAGLTDISVATRRQKNYGPPDGLFVIHLDNGIAKTLKRAYPDKLNMKWQNAFTIGTAKAVAIVFDGHWERYRKLWQLVTKDVPEIFWVDTSNVLWTQSWDKTITKLELATSVLKIKALRGWRNTAIRIQDTGIIAAYIKTDGKVYYRNFTEQIAGPRGWEYEKQVTTFTGIAVNLNLFLTNDYRTAIIIEDNLGQTHWYITDRNWAGMAIAPENVSVRLGISELIMHKVFYTSTFENEYVSATIDLIPECLFALTDIKVKYVYNYPIEKINAEDESYEDWGFAVRVRFTYEIVGAFTIEIVDTAMGSVYSIEHIEVIDPGYEYNLLIDSAILEYGFNISSGELSIRLKDAYNAASYLYEPVFHGFIPINLERPDIPVPEVEVIWND